MKGNVSPMVCRLGRLAFVTSLFSFLGLSRVFALDVTDDPSLRVTLTRSSQNAVVSWVGATSVPYQVETSTNLTTWSSVGPLLTGNGGVLSVTNATAGRPLSFYRVSRQFPAATNSATFNPVTGLLTIVGDDFDNVITVGRNGDFIIVNGGAIAITGGTPTVTNTVLIQVLGLGGNDQITMANGLPPAHLFGGSGNDTLIGGSAAELFVGGPGNDFVDGNQGNDTIFLGEGDDTVQWDPGDGSDTIEGQGGNDTLVSNGANIAEKLTLSANGSRLQFTRDVATITLDVNGVEQVNVRALGGADVLTVNPLTSTDVKVINLDLGAVGGVSDGAIDTVNIIGTAEADTFNVTNNAGVMEVSGLGTLVRVVNGTLTNDSILITGVGGDLVNVHGSPGADTMTITPNGTFARVDATGFSVPVNVNGAPTLSVNGWNGPDTISGANGLSTLITQLIIDGGDGDDILNGGDGNDLILGGPGKDTISGNRGNDTILAGADDDIIQWNPGDGSDTIEGQGGNDKLIFNGANINENLALSANGSRLRLTRDIAAITLDVNGVEQVDLRALGGADNLVVNTLISTDVKLVNLDLGASGGGSDGAVDTITIYGPAGPATFNVTNNAGAMEITGAGPQIRVLNGAVAEDLIVLNGSGGDSVTVQGSSGADSTTITPNGVYTRVDASAFTVPINIAGALKLSVNGWSGSNTVTLNGTAGPDTFSVTNNAGVMEITGPGPQVRVLNGNFTNDLLFINGIGGDLVKLHGSPGADTINITPNGVYARVDASNFTVPINLSGNPALSVFGWNGPDTITGANGLSTLISQLQIDGGEGDDILLGGDGNDLIIGGPGKDTISGNRGNDTILAGEDDDIIQWNPGDGSDTIEGQGGNDTLVFNGANITENLTFLANGSRLRLTRDVGAITMDVNGVEQVNLRALGGADNLNVNSLIGTDVKLINLDLAASGGGSDGAVDTVNITGTAGPDTFNVTNNAGVMEVSGLGALVRVVNGTSTNDSIVITGVGGDQVNVHGSPGADTMTITPNGTFARVDATGFSVPVNVTGALSLFVYGWDGPDTISGANGLAALGIQLSIDGGEGDDILNGGDGNDLIIGGPGKDTISGNRGNDTILAGEGDDIIQWNPGDGSDTIEGQGGNDTLVFNGANIAENLNLLANGSRLRLTRDVGAITLDVNGVEQVDVRALGGADNLIVNSLAGTDVTLVNLFLNSSVGGGDGAADTITVQGTALPDAFSVINNIGVVEVTGLAAKVRILTPEVALDQLILNGLGGTDTFSIGAGVSSLITVITNQN